MNSMLNRFLLIALDSYAKDYYVVQILFGLFKIAYPIGRLRQNKYSAGALIDARGNVVVVVVVFGRSISRGREEKQISSPLPRRRTPRSSKQSSSVVRPSSTDSLVLSLFFSMSLSLNVFVRYVHCGRVRWKPLFTESESVENPSAAIRATIIDRWIIAAGDARGYRHHNR